MNQNRPKLKSPRQLNLKKPTQIQSLQPLTLEELDGISGGPQLIVIRPN